jgi:hypothetical protein
MLNQIGTLEMNLAPPAALPPGAVTVSLLGIDYVHLKTHNGGDLYLTKFGLPFWEHLLPQNWYAKEWFEAKRKRLIGTSTVYRVPTKTVHGRVHHLVAKWSRVGEVVPMDTLTINQFIQAEFNSPFEEFSLLTELRQGKYGPPGIRIRTQKPLAIYVPSERLQLWQTGRSESKIAAKLARHPGVELDILRQYVVIYGWIKGLDLIQVADLFELDAGKRELFFARTTSLVMHELEHKGYRVVDMKPAHIIVRPLPGRQLLRDHNGQIAYALVDYELMERTGEHEQAVRSAQRQHYLQHMARRFEISSNKPLPPHLKPTTIMGVDYIFGHAESTGGRVWVVGKDPDLFNYFIPERWRRTPNQPLSSTKRVFQTRTKDNINLVWKISRLGEVPEQTRRGTKNQAIQKHGYNSPFEEFAHALELSKAGFRTVYPRAIYMTGHKTTRSSNLADPSRYTAIKHILTPDGQPVLCPDYDYITIWGFWNGPDELLAQKDGQFYRGINAKEACRDGYISETLLAELLQKTKRKLAHCRFEDLHLTADHLLLSFSPDKKMVKDTFGKPEVRLCNFELIRKLPAAPQLPPAKTKRRRSKTRAAQPEFPDPIAPH